MKIGSNMHRVGPIYRQEAYKERMHDTRERQHVLALKHMRSDSIKYK